MSEPDSWAYVCFKTRIWDMAERKPNGPRWRVTVEVPGGPIDTRIEPIGNHAEMFKDFWDFPSNREVYNLTMEVWAKCLTTPAS